jgi:CSLREA domain-containing protein
MQASSRIKYDVIGVTLPLLLLFAAAPVQAARLIVAAPQQVKRGDRFLVTIVPVPSAGALEGAVRYDHRRATLLSVTPAAAGPRRAVQALGPVRRGASETFGYFSCPAARCGARPAPAVDGRPTVMEFQAEQAGAMRLELGRFRSASADGTVARATTGRRALDIRVLPESAPSPARGRQRAVRILRPDGRRRLHARADRNGDGAVDLMDATQLAYAWTLARADAPCEAGATDDVDADGCLTVADAQLLAARARARRPAAGAAANATLTVDSAGDAPDAAADGICRTANGRCTLRAAIAEANAAPGPNTIAFAIPGPGVHTIQLGTALPPLTDTTGPTTIDGRSQPGSVANTARRADNAKLMIQLRGTGYDRIDGLSIFSNGNVVKGIAAYRLRCSIALYGSGAHDNSIRGNFIGTNAAATAAARAYNLFGSGVIITNGAAGNHIGEPWREGRNVISGNSRHGVATYGAGTERNVIANNLIGLAPGGDRSVPNQKHGVDLNDGSSFNRVGGTGPQQHNVISGNGNPRLHDFPAGVEVSHSTTTVGNQIVGNLIGTTITGRSAAPYTANEMYGIRIEDGVHGTVIADNVIGNNLGGGIKVDSPSTSRTTISGNRVGISRSGAGIPNGHFGILLAWHASHSTIGPGNVLAHNPVGIEIGHRDSDFNTITRNRMFANTGLGIDLEPWGHANPNDPGDRDQGTNQQLNFPVIRAAHPTGATGSACAGCTVEVFQADAAPPAAGEGERFLGSDVAGRRGRFSVQAPLPAGAPITATATDRAGNTSEFSPSVRVAVSR